MNGSQSRIVDMDPQLTTQEPICDLLNCSSVGVITGFGFTHDGVLDEELFLEIVANLVCRHDEGGRLMWRILTRTRRTSQSRTQ